MTETAVPATLDIARCAALAADAKKATDLCLIDLTGVSDVADAFVICTGANTRLVDSVIDEVEERVREDFGISPIAIEGRETMTWVVMDYGSFLVHCFTPEARDYYRLERLWGDAPRVDLGLDE